MTNQRIEGIRKMLTDSVELTAPNNQARGWRTDCEYLLAKVDDLLADLKQCEPHLRSLARLCEACDGSGEIMTSQDTAEECEYCRPIWNLAERVNPPPPPPEPVYEEIQDDIPF
jgi:hypothetical protein